MVFFTAQCKTVSMMDLPHKEAAENMPRTNTVGTFISTKSQTLLRLKHANNRATKMTPIDKTSLKIRRTLSFDMSSKVAQDFLPWLTGSGGGCKSVRQAHQIVSRCLKFLNSVAKTTRISHLKSLTLVYVHLISFSNLLA